MKNRTFFAMGILSTPMVTAINAGWTFWSVVGLGLFMMGTGVATHYFVNRSKQLSQTN